MKLPTIYENSLVSDFKNELWVRCVKTVNEYRMLSPGDKVCVGISGGIDSAALAVCMMRLQRFGRIPFEAVYTAAVSGMEDVQKRTLLRLCETLDIPVQTQDVTPAALPEFAQRCGCNKLALGLHLDDAAEHILTGLLFEARMQALLPRVKETPELERILPFYRVRREHIRQWQAQNTLEALPEESSPEQITVRDLLSELRQNDPDVDKHVLRSAENVNLQTLISYRKDGTLHHFLDRYGEGLSIRGTKPTD